MSRILAVSHTTVWPARSGAAIRRLMTLRALAELGEVDLLYVGEPNERVQPPPPDEPVRNLGISRVKQRRLSTLERAWWMAWPRQPLQVLGWESGLPIALPAPPYDLVWYFRPVAFALAAAGIPVGSSVVDFDDLEDRKLRLARSVGPQRGSLAQRMAQARGVVAWRRYQDHVASLVDAVTVASPEDCNPAWGPTCHVVRNGFPDVTSGRALGRPSPILLLVGLFSYGPNADAAEFLVEQVLPLLRAAVPAAQVRLVGEPTPRIQRLAGPGVTVVGVVDDLAQEYAHAAVAVAPIRVGSGTRVKILEAFARSVPVVSTSVGAAGLEARAGEHLLLANTPTEIADACAALLRSQDGGREMAARARQLYERDYSQAAVSKSVAVVVGSLAGA